jgi:hypothetical protein
MADDPSPGQEPATKKPRGEEEHQSTTTMVKRGDLSGARLDYVEVIITPVEQFAFNTKRGLFDGSQLDDLRPHSAKELRENARYLALALTQDGRGGLTNEHELDLAPGFTTVVTMGFDDTVLDIQERRRRGIEGAYVAEVFLPQVSARYGFAVMMPLDHGSEDDPASCTTLDLRYASRGRPLQVLTEKALYVKLGLAEPPSLLQLMLPSVMAFARANGFSRLRVYHPTSFEETFLSLTGATGDRGVFFLDVPT